MGVKTEDTKLDGREGEMDLPDVGDGMDSIKPRHTHFSNNNRSDQIK